MIAFNKKDIDHISTVGYKLKKERLSRSLELSNISDKLSIDIKHIDAIEKGEFDRLPSDVYVKNFLQVYGQFLGFDPSLIIDEYVKEKQIYKMSKKADNKIFEVLNSSKKNFYRSFNVAKLLKNFTIFILIVASLFFLANKVNNIIAPPRLEITNPKEEHLIIQDNSIKVSGKVDVGTKVLINGQNITISPDGNFQESLDLQLGLNIIKISATKKYSRSNEITREIMVHK